ncbi:MAG: EamA family transporter [Flavisolibacter sp.]|jgi:drug/metabolite transporter (DMT)-like permease|nr:EamA family transporter [Flavisolibacter sp.]
MNPEADHRSEKSKDGGAHYFAKLNPLTIRQRGTKSKALFALALVCFFWGTTWVASKEAVKFMHPLQMAGIRQLLGGLCYLGFFLFKGARWPRGKEWITILVLSFLNFMLSNALSTWGIKYISAGLGAIIGAIFPLWLVIIGLAGTSTKANPKTVFGLLLGFSGICVIFYEHLHDFLDPRFRLGIFLSLASTWSWAFGTLYTKKQAVNFNPYFSLGLQMIISGLLLNMISSVAGTSLPVESLPWQGWAAIAYLVIFGSVISFIAYLYALQNLSTEQASLYAYINPVVAVLLGWMIFEEKLTAFIITGTLITLYGVFLVNRSITRSR